MDRIFLDTLTKGCETLNIHLNSRQQSQCERFFRLLIDWNRSINLTTITDPLMAAEKLFLDALCLLPQLTNRATLLDVGSGAGFPGIVLKVVRPELTVHLIESTRKKVNFQKQVILELGLKDIFSYWKRLCKEPIEEIVRLGAFDVITFRAVGAISELAALLLPYLASEGIIIAMKGPTVSAELSSLEGSGMKVRRIIPYTLPLLRHKRTLVILEKESGKS